LFAFIFFNPLELLYLFAIIPIPGMKRRQYLKENAAAAGIQLSQALMDELDALGRQVAGERHNAQNLLFVDQ